MSPSLAALFSRFLGVGALSTLLLYTVLLLGVWLGYAPVVASAVGFALGVLLSYGLNYHWTFASTREHKYSLPRFLVVSLGGWLLNGLIVWLGGQLGIHFLLAQLVSSALVLVFQFLAHAAWSFAHPALARSRA